MIDPAPFPRALMIEQVKLRRVVMIVLHYREAVMTAPGTLEAVVLLDGVHDLTKIAQVLAANQRHLRHPNSRRLNEEELRNRAPHLVMVVENKEVDPNHNQERIEVDPNHRPDVGLFPGDLIHLQHLRIRKQCQRIHALFPKSKDLLETLLRILKPF